VSPPHSTTNVWPGHDRGLLLAVARLVSSWVKGSVPWGLCSCKWGPLLTFGWAAAYDRLCQVLGRTKAYFGLGYVLAVTIRIIPKPIEFGIQSVSKDAHAIPCINSKTIEPSIQPASEDVPAYRPKPRVPSSLAPAKHKPWHSQTPDPACSQACRSQSSDTAFRKPSPRLT
jgi:hypothetical protein